jgi:hypothetical protein
LWQPDDELLRRVLFSAGLALLALSGLSLIWLFLSSVLNRDIERSRGTLWGIFWTGFLLGVGLVVFLLIPVSVPR